MPTTPPDKVTNLQRRKLQISETFSNSCFLLQHQASDDATDRIQKGQHVEDSQGARNHVLEIVRLICSSRHQADGRHDLHFLYSTAPASRTDFMYANIKLSK